ncbi:MAG: ECF transporter S component [Lachnospiraceae bacterium]|nr:ECF transporter S component [Lachnospiraceae bacterium]
MANEQAIAKTFPSANAKAAGKKKLTTKYIAFVGMFSAVASVLMFLEIPLPFAPSFYKIDFSEVPALIGGFAMGPLAGVLIELIKILVHLLIKGTQTAGVGEVANFIIGCSLVVPASLIYKRAKTKNHAIVGMVIGTLLMTIVGPVINAYVLLPTYAAAFHMPMDALIGMGTAVNSHITSLLSFCILAVAPFNLVKGVAVSLITMLLYKHISPVIHSAGI